MKEIGVAGASARTQYEQLRGQRERRLEIRFGRFAPVAKVFSEETMAERNWRIGAEGEERFAARRTRRLESSDLVVLHDCRIPRSHANIDHVYVGPSGVLVADTKRYDGKARVKGRRLIVKGRDRTSLVEDVHKQVAIVTSILSQAGFDQVAVRGAICWMEVEGLPILTQRLDGIPICSPRMIRKLAVREGPLVSGEIEALGDALTASLIPTYAGS